MNLFESIKHLAGKIGLGRSHTPNPATGSECPHEADLFAYSQDRLSHRRREQLETHLLGCDDCRDSLALFARSFSDVTEPELPPLTDSAVKEQAARVLTYIKEDEFNRRRPDRVARTAGATRGAAGLFIPTRMLVTAGLMVCAIAIGAVYYWSLDESNNETAMRMLVLSTKDERLIEPRLSGNLPYSPYPSARRGEDEAKSPVTDLQFDRAEAELRAAEDPSAPVEDRLTLARVWLARNKPAYTARALRILEQIVSVPDPSTESLNDMGVALFQLGRYDEAINYFNRALDKSPAYNEALFNRAMSKQKAGHEQEAQADWKRFIDSTADERWKEEARLYLK